jgi:hypothetical protein
LIRQKKTERQHEQDKTEKESEGKRKIAAKKERMQHEGKRKARKKGAGKTRCKQQRQLSAQNDETPEATCGKERREKEGRSMQQR